MHDYYHKVISNKFSYLILLICIIAVGLFLRIYQLGYDQLWTDEAFTGYIALTEEWLTYLRIDNTPPLYYLIQRAWCGPVTCNEFVLRLPSVFAGGFFILLIGMFCKQLFGKKVAIIIVLIAALSPIHIYYSQEARVYSILLLTLLIFLYLQWHLINKEAKPGEYFLFFSICLIAFFLHYFSLIVIVVCLFVFTVENILNYRKISRGYFIAVGLSIALFIPWLLFSVLNENATSSELGWIANYYSDKSVWQLPTKSLSAFLSGPQLYLNEIGLSLKRNSYMEKSTLTGPVIASLTGIFLILYFTVLINIRTLQSPWRLYFYEFTSFLVLPLFALIIISSVITPVYVVGRYDLIAYPAFLLLTGSVIHSLLNTRNGVSKLFLNSFMLVVFCVLITVNLYQVLIYKNATPYHSLVTDGKKILSTLNNDDGLLIASPNAIEILYYLHLQGIHKKNEQCNYDQKYFKCRLFPKNLEEAPALLDRYTNLPINDKQTFNINYFLDDLSPDSQIVLILDSFKYEEDQFILGPVGFGLLSSLTASGYTINEVITEGYILVLTKLGQ